MNARSQTTMCLVAMMLVASCAPASGFDPARPNFDQPSAAADPEVEPLPPTAKRQMGDPRGAGDAGVSPALVVVTAVTVAPAAPIEPATPVAKASPALAATCGSKKDPCPMQRFMRGTMATAHTAGTLTSAFTRVAGMSPDSAWRWVAIATRGAELANAGDLAGAKAQCKACHDAYEDLYRSRHRARRL